MADPAVPQSGPRYQLILPVVCKAAPQKGRFPRVVSGWTFNLSETGACVELPEEFILGTWLRLTLPLEDKSLPLPARVGWVAHPGAPDGRVVHGLIFLRLTANQRQEVQSLLRRQRSLSGGAARIPATLPAECRVLGVPEPALRGWTGDLSREGCSLLLPDELPVGTRIMVTLTGPRGVQSMGATVAWAAPATRGQPTLRRHGVRFLDVNPVWEHIRGGDVASLPRPAGRLAAATV